MSNPEHSLHPEMQGVYRIGQRVYPFHDVAAGFQTGQRLPYTVSAIFGLVTDEELPVLRFSVRAETRALGDVTGRVFRFYGDDNQLRESGIMISETEKTDSGKVKRLKMDPLYERFFSHLGIRIPINGGSIQMSPEYYPLRSGRLIYQVYQKKDGDQQFPAEVLIAPLDDQQLSHFHFSFTMMNGWTKTPVPDLVKLSFAPRAVREALEIFSRADEL